MQCIKVQEFSSGIPAFFNWFVTATEEITYRSIGQLNNHPTGTCAQDIYIY